MGNNKKRNGNGEKTVQTLCSLPEIQERDLSHLSDRRRARLILSLSRAWVNGTTLTYYFFDEPKKWSANKAQKEAVRNAFMTWKEVGIGLNFHEVSNAEDAIIKIGFDQSDGSWSYVGRDCIDHASNPNERTTNYGWDLTTPHGNDTALHEIGHILGFHHAHQNQRAGIVWNEEEVYRRLGGSPNFWPREVTHWNIIRKIPLASAIGTDWDKDSIMQYAFESGMINTPEEYQDNPLIPNPGLSPIDIQTIKSLYPEVEPDIPELNEFESRAFNVSPGDQLNFHIETKENRKYTIQTFGTLDTIMVLFEDKDGTEEYISADDDSGQDFNSQITTRLHKGKKYIVRLRLFYAENQGRGSIMLY